MSYIEQLFDIDRSLKGATTEKRYQKRQETSKVVLEAFWSWLEKTALLETTNDKLTKALNYAANHRTEFTTFLEDGALDLSNNLCEASLRPFATHRKSWLFTDTPAGATANAIMYTIVETAKLNNLNVFEYLKYLLEEMPNIDFYNNPELINQYTPWAEELPDRCRMIKK